MIFVGGIGDGPQDGAGCARQTAGLGDGAALHLAGLRAEALHDQPLVLAAADDDDVNYNISSSNNIINSYSSSSSSNSNNKNNNNDDLTNLILSQNVIEGSWDENDQTKKVISIVTQGIFDKIKNKIIALNKGTNENKIIYTILVMYYLKTKCANKLSQYRHVINKANKFLNKNGVDYDNIVSGI